MRDEITKLHWPYKLQYYTKPIVLYKLASYIVEKIKDPDTVLFSFILETVGEAMPFISRTLGIILENNEVELDINKFMCPHLQKTCIAGAYVAK